MNILFYADTVAADGDRLLQKIESQVSADVIQAYRSLDGFKQGLRKRPQKPEAVVLMAADAAELKRIAAMRKLLADLRILLVLPDRCKETVAAGHRLWPRYIGYADSDFEDVAAVVRQILKLCKAGGQGLPARKEAIHETV